jgi:hypothetical protein
LPPDGFEKTFPGRTSAEELAMCPFLSEETTLFEKQCTRPFLYHAIKEGMDMGIVNPSMLMVYDDIPKDLLAHVEDVLLDLREDATGTIVKFCRNSFWKRKSACS